MPYRLEQTEKDAPAMLHGPGGLMATPGLGKRRGRKWGNRTKDAQCTCGVTTKGEQLAPGVTRIRGNLCNVHGRYGPCDQSGAANVQRGIVLSRSAAPGKRASGRKRAGGGKGGAKPKKATVTPEQRQAEQEAKRQAKQGKNRQSVIDAMANADAGLQPAAAKALLSFADGKEDPAFTDGLVKAGLMERGRDGVARLTAAGRNAVAAMDRGDTRDALDAIGRAGDQRAARADREQAATERKRAADQRKADAEQRRAERQKKGGGGGKRTAPKGLTPEQQQRQALADQRRADADRRRGEADKRRVAADQRRQQNERQRQSRDAQREEQRQRGLTDLAQRMEAGNKLSDEELQKLIVEGLAERQGSMIRMTAAGRQQARRKPKTTTKAQTAEDRAMFAKLGKGGGGRGWSRIGGVRAPPYQSTMDRGRARLQSSGFRNDSAMREALSRAQGSKDKLHMISQSLASGQMGGRKIDAATRRNLDVQRRGLERRQAQALREVHRLSIIEKSFKAASPGDYLIVEDRTKPTTWHLQVKRGGKPDHGLMGSAWAALHGGFRGNVYQGPSKQEAIAKLIRLYKQEGMPLPSEKSFAVFKDASGAYRWIARTTTAYRDRDQEIITTKALEQDAARMQATGQYGPLRYWHLGQPDPFNPAAPWGVGVDVGDCDYSTVIGRTSIESGTFKSQAIGRAFAASAADYELSPGFFHPPDQPNAAGEYHDIRRFERSVVPVEYGRASNLFTGMTVKEHRMDQATYEARVKAYLADMQSKGVPPEVAAQSLASMEQADKSAQQQGIAFKSDDAPPDPWAAVVAALKAAVAPPAVEAEKAPPMMADAETPEETAAEPGEEPGESDGGDYIGDMPASDFWAQLTQVIQSAIAPALKMDDMHKKMGDMLGELKSMYTTKDAGTQARIAQVEAELATLKGDQPAVVENEALAALKSKGPQAPPSADTPQIPDDPNRPLAGLAAGLMPQLYGGAAPVQGFANGWQLGQPPQPPLNTGGN